MRSCHTVSAGFDDPNLVSCAGLIPVMTLAERVGLHDLARAHVRVPGSAGSNPDVMPCRNRDRSAHLTEPVPARFMPLRSAPGLGSPLDAALCQAVDDVAL